MSKLLDNCNFWAFNERVHLALHTNISNKLSFFIQIFNSFNFLEMARNKIHFGVPSF